MWAVVRTVVVWVFGDDILKIALYAVVGLFVVVYVEATGATAAIMGQPWGQWWLAGVGGGAQSAASQPIGPQQPTSPQTAAVVAPIPTLAPLQGVVLDRVTTIISNAMTWLGVRYLWAGCTRAGVDCSCFLQNVLLASGVRGVPRTTITQIAWTHPVTWAQMQPTDFIYFNNTCGDCGPNPTHVGMYLGDGKMIHAGDPVHIESIETPYWRAHFNSAGRIP